MRQNIVQFTMKINEILLSGMKLGAEFMLSIVMNKCIQVTRIIPP